MNNNYDYTIYTDGGCIKNPGGAGGYGVVMIDNETGEMSELSEGFKSSTNNRMEIMAVTAALKALPKEKSAIIYSDSQYVVNTVNRDWARNANEDLWNPLFDELKKKKAVLRWVKGHDGEEYNERCDQLATEAYSKDDLKEDKGYKPVSETNVRVGAMTAEIFVPEYLDSKIDECGFPRYSEKYGVNEECALAILNFAKSMSHSFASYKALKTGGMDSWSSMTEEELAMSVVNGDEVLECIERHLPARTDKLSAMRWVARGLPVKDAIRKVLVDKEINAKCGGGNMQLQQMSLWGWNGKHE